MYNNYCDALKSKMRGCHTCQKMLIKIYSHVDIFRVLNDIRVKNL